MGIAVWIWALFFLLNYKEKAGVCKAYAVSPGRNHTTSICSPPCLLVLNSSNIIAFDHETSDITSVKSGLSEAVTLDFHFSLGYIFWSDLIEQSIKRFSIDIGTTTTLIASIGVCAGLAVEWRTSRLYWTDSTFNKISVSDVNGLNQHSLIAKLEEPRDIALDPDSGLMFWADWDHGVHPKIKRASLNGSQIKAVVTVNLHRPTGINLDRGNRRIFWLNSRIGTVESVDYDGDNRRVLFKQSYPQPFGLTLSPPFLFLTAWQILKQVYQLDAITGKLLRSYSISNRKPMDIVAYDESRQPPASHPCSVNNGGCSHFCVPKTSGYECVCSTGLLLKQDGKTCQKKVKKFVLFTDSEARSINMISLDVNYSIAQPLLNHLYDQRPTAMDFDPVEDRLYWSDVEKGRIMSAFTNATSMKTLFSCNVLKPYGLAIDRVGRNIYWTDAGTNRIEVGLLDGTKRKLLFKNELEEPRAIVLDEKNGIMVWTAWGPKPNIAKAKMDGSGRHTIVTGNLSKPDGLTIDRVTDSLYWVDALLDIIEMSDLNGGHRQVILSSAAGIKPFRLAFYQDALYWTDPNYKRIELYDLSHGKRKTIVLDMQKPTDIHVYDPSISYSDSHPCVQNNGSCSDFCLLKPEGYRCACPTGVALKFDGKNCDNDMSGREHSWMLLTEPDSGQINNVSLSIPNNPCYPLEIKTNMSRPTAVNYDPLEEKIYWTDAIGLVARAYPDGLSAEVVAYINVDSPQGLAVDYIGRNLFWCDSGTNKIEVARLDGSYRTTLINSSTEHPMAIVLDIARRKMYWSGGGKSPKIEQANMDGSARKVLVNSGLSYVNSFALDHSRGVLYWCDTSLRRIERLDLQGNNRVVILDLSFDNWNPYGLALSHNILYFSDWRKNAVYKYNMSSSDMDVMVQGMGFLMDLHIYDYKSSYKGSTSCSQLNGGCSHLCLPNPFGHQCFCPEGVPLKPHDRYTCQGVITCGPLVPPVNAVISPPTCQSRSYQGQECRLLCQLPGYILVGVGSRVCGSDGKWTGSNNSRCKDITPPSFTTTCPRPLVFYADECSSNALVSWDEPVAIDNSGNVSVTYPAIRPPIRLSSGSDQLNYIATDSSENWVNCSFNLRVITRSCSTLQPPINGNVSFSCGHWFGSKANFSCNCGYQLLGSRRRRCDEKGVWSGPPTTCTREKQSSVETNHLSNTWLGILVVSFAMILVVFTIYISHLKFRARDHSHIGNAFLSYDIWTINGTYEVEPICTEPCLPDRKEGDCFPNSFPTVPLLKYITQVEGYFSSSGGELSTAPDSDVKIVIGNGAIGDNQLVFFRVVDNETELLRDIPVGSKNTLISPVIECGPHDIRISKPLEIVIPHCLCKGKAKGKWISVYRTDPGPTKWEKVPNELEKDDLSKAWFIAKEDSIHIMTMTFCFWSIFSCGGPRKKRARVFANKPYPGCDLVYLRFYIYDDNEDSRKRVENQEERSFISSMPTIEKPFKMYNNSKKIIVRLEDLKEGWEPVNEADAHQEFTCLNANGRRFRYEGACEFLVKQIEGGVGNNFTCKIKFQQEGRDEEHTLYVIPRFAPEEKLEPVNDPRQNSTEAAYPQAISTTRTHLSSPAGCSTPSAVDESDTGNLKEHSGRSRESKLLSSLLDNWPFLEKVCNRLDTKKPGVGDYRDVCSHYGIDSYKVTAVFEKNEDGPSRVLLEHLRAACPRLTVAEFVVVLRKIAEREDVALPLKEYDNL